MNVLPMELIGYILQFLDNKDFGNCMKASKIFHVETFTQICKRRYGDPSTSTSTWCRKMLDNADIRGLRVFFNNDMSIIETETKTNTDFYESGGKEACLRKGDTLKLLKFLSIECKMGFEWSDSFFLECVKNSRLDIIRYMHFTGLGSQTRDGKGAGVRPYLIAFWGKPDLLRWYEMEYGFKTEYLAEYRDAAAFYESKLFFKKLLKSRRSCELL
jgi:hypothetical protein